MLSLQLLENGSLEIGINWFAQSMININKAENCPPIVCNQSYLQVIFINCCINFPGGHKTTWAWASAKVKYPKKPCDIWCHCEKLPSMSQWFFKNVKIFDSLDLVALKIHASMANLNNTVAKRWSNM